MAANAVSRTNVGWNRGPGPWVWARIGPGLGPCISSSTRGRKPIQMIRLVSGPRSQSEQLYEKACENMSEGSGSICISACLGSSILQVFFCHIALSVVAFLATISRLVLISGLDCKGSFCHDHLLTQLGCWHSPSSISPDIKSCYQGGCPRSLLSCQDWSHSPIQIKRMSCSTNQYMRWKLMTLTQKNT